MVGAQSYFPRVKEDVIDNRLGNIVIRVTKLKFCNTEMLISRARPNERPSCFFALCPVTIVTITKDSNFSKSSSDQATDATTLFFCLRVDDIQSYSGFYCLFLSEP